MGYEELEASWKKPSNASPLFDGTIPYPGYHGCPSKCRIRLFRVYGAPVIVCTELEENVGTSVTNTAEVIATLVWNVLGKPENLQWIEHYADRAFFGKKPTMREEFDLVVFERRDSGLLERFCHPRWRRISKEEAESLCGATL